MSTNRLINNTRFNNKTAFAAGNRIILLLLIGNHLVNLYRNL